MWFKMSDWKTNKNINTIDSFSKQAEWLDCVPLSMSYLQHYSRKHVYVVSQFNNPFRIKLYCPYSVKYNRKFTITVDS